MTGTAPPHDARNPAALPRRGAPPVLLVLWVVASVLAVAALVGVRYGALLLVGLALGMTLEGLRFGFSGPWRAMILRREPAGLIAQLVAIGIVAAAAFPILAAADGSVIGAHAPLSAAMVPAAFLFGAAMQVILGCGSGTLVNAGSGNAVAAVALPFFALGSFLGATHVQWWTDLAALPPVVLSGPGGLGLTLLGLAAVAGLALWRAAPGKRAIPRRLWIAAVLVGVFAILNLVVAGQPWGVVYGLGLWFAKGVTALGGDLSGWPFWGAPANVERLQASVLNDVTSLTNFGLIGGAFLIAAWRRGGMAAKVAPLPARAWIAAIAAGIVLGYTSRVAFGCNVGAFFSGVSTGSLHGWVWFAAAFAGSYLGIWLRPRLGLEPRT
jgi:hypothetical protein